MTTFSHGSIRGLQRPTGRVASVESMHSSAEGRAKFGTVLNAQPQQLCHQPLKVGDEIPRRVVELLEQLASTMVEVDVDVEKDATYSLTRSSNMQFTGAGYTYLGQFIDHDLTFDPASTLQKVQDPHALNDFRTPAFDLDSMYGSGPDDMPYLYDQSVEGRFLIAHNDFGVEDLPRNLQGIALIGDKRNNENQIVGQLHLAFLKFHNRVFEELSSSGSPSARFQEANEQVRFHYQWIVLTDFLPRIVQREVLKKIYPTWDFHRRVPPILTELRKPKLDLFRWEDRYEYPFLPVEFSVAAYRFGHSMVRSDYALNRKFHGEGKEVAIFSSDDELDLRGFQPLRRDLRIEWDLFFGEIDRDNLVQPARSIDTLIASRLSHLPSVVVASRPSLATRNLLRGVALRLPSGQDAAREIMARTSLRFEILGQNRDFVVGPPQDYRVHDENRRALVSDPSVPVADRRLLADLTQQLGSNTPLWYYVLKEAEELQNGACLGWVGSFLLAETFVGLLTADRASFVHSQDWMPRAGRFGCRADGRYTVLDLLRFAGAL
jgi:hypothetical protein